MISFTEIPKPQEGMNGLSHRMYKRFMLSSQNSVWSGCRRAHGGWAFGIDPVLDVLQALTLGFRQEEQPEQNAKSANPGVQAVGHGPIADALRQQCRDQDSAHRSQTEREGENEDDEVDEGKVFGKGGTCGNRGKP
jgi:hypothetical protein